MAPSPALHRIPTPRLLVPERTIFCTVVGLLHEPPAIPVVDDILTGGTERQVSDARAGGFLNPQPQLPVVDEHQVIGGTLGRSRGKAGDSPPQNGGHKCAPPDPVNYRGSA